MAAIRASLRASAQRTVIHRRRIDAELMSTSAWKGKCFMQRELPRIRDATATAQGVALKLEHGGSVSLFDLRTGGRQVPVRQVLLPLPRRASSALVRRWPVLLPGVPRVLRPPRAKLVFG